MATTIIVEGIDKIFLVTPILKYDYALLYNFATSYHKNVSLFEKGHTKIRWLKKTLALYCILGLSELVIDIVQS